MSKEQVIDYVMNSPANTNKAVLEGMLDEMGGADVPTPTVEDAGKLLGVGNDGKYVLKQASQGGGADASTITMRTIDADSQSAYTYISEEDANKVFNGYPIGYKLAQSVDGVDNGSRIGMHLMQASPTLTAYAGSAEGMDIKMDFVPQQSINFTMKQGETVLQSIELEWNAELKRYHTEISE